MADLQSLKEIIDNKDLPEQKELDSQKTGSWGGVRKNAGRKPGSLNKNTAALKEVKKEFNQRVAAAADRLFNAQIGVALGQTFLYVKTPIYDKDGKVIRRETTLVTDPEIIQQYVDDDGTTLNQEGEDYYFITTQPANNQAIESMLNRAFGKATEKVEIEGGFFKADTLNIQIINPEEKKIIDVEPESDNSQAEHETEPGTGPTE